MLHSRNDRETEVTPTQFRIDDHCTFRPDPSEGGRLTIPYWFMDSDDFVRLFRAAPGVQRPVLLNALSLARQEGLGPQSTILRDMLMQECRRVLALTATGVWQDRNAIGVICNGVVTALEDAQNQSAIQELIQQYPSLQDYRGQREVPASESGSRTPGLRSTGHGGRQQADALLNDLIAKLAAVPTIAMRGGSSSADRPSYFGKTAFRYRHLETAISRDQSNSARTRDNCSTMLTRIYRLLEDSRFEFCLDRALRSGRMCDTV